MIEELSESEIEAFLRRQLVGRVGCHAFGRTYVVPVIYVWDDGYVYVQSMEGRKIRMMRANPEVCFEVDEYEPDGSWRSVVVEGVFEELEGGAAETALALLVHRFAGRRRRTAGRGAGRRPVAFRIRCTQATGRRVTRTPAARALTRAGVALSRRRARVLRG
ncbi:MAG TPA: pyridoxamine 5'-phosphate oxidase family protein [Gaiellaceae bacterium]|nr:pyridoxamine 5'-phosphate oxidase family protein [Gaiellaceae bacterium]